MQSKFLGFVWVWNLKEPAVADQPPVRQREYLCGEEKLPLAARPHSGAWAAQGSSLRARKPALGLMFRNILSCRPRRLQCASLACSHFPTLPLGVLLQDRGKCPLLIRPPFDSFRQVPDFLKHHAHMWTSTQRGMHAF